MRRNRDKLFLLILILFFSCNAKRIEIRSSSEVPITNASKALEKLRSEKNIHSARIMANVKLDSPKQRFFFKQMLMAKRSGKLYMTSLKFGTPVIHISANKEKVKVYDPRESIFFEGSGTKTILEKLIGIGIEFEDINEIALGSLHIPPSVTISSAWRINEKYIRIKFNNKEGKFDREIFIDERSGNLVYGKFGYGNDKEVEVFFGDHKKVNDHMFPKKIILIKNDPYLEVVLKIKELELNKEIKDSSFEMNIPQGFIPYPIDDLKSLF